MFTNLASDSISKGDEFIQTLYSCLPINPLVDNFEVLCLNPGLITTFVISKYNHNLLNTSGNKIAVPRS